MAALSGKHDFTQSSFSFFPISVLICALPTYILRVMLSGAKHPSTIHSCIEKRSKGKAADEEERARAREIGNLAGICIIYRRNISVGRERERESVRRRRHIALYNEVSSHLTRVDFG